MEQNQAKKSLTEEEIRRERLNESYKIMKQAHTIFDELKLEVVTRSSFGLTDVYQVAEKGERLVEKVNLIIGMANEIIEEGTKKAKEQAPDDIKSYVSEHYRHSFYADPPSEFVQEVLEEAMKQEDIIVKGLLNRELVKKITQEKIHQIVLISTTHQYRTVKGISEGIERIKLHAEPLLVENKEVKGEE